MALRDILVHLDNSDRCAERLRLAVTLAGRDPGCRLVGLFAEKAPATRVGVVATWPSADHLAAAATNRDTFVALTAALGERAEWVDSNRGGEAEVIARTVEFARTADLVVLGQSLEGQGNTPPDLVEQVIMESGRPVLVVPHAGHYPTVGERPLFAWNGSRAAARALGDALPLVTPGADALVVHATQPAIPVDETGARVVAHLAANGITARFASFVVEEVKLMDMLLNQAADHSADLMALGAFENVGFPFVGRGSGTRWVLRHMTLPVLFSH